MSIDSIIKISIDTQSLNMAQTGFGVPLIIGEGKKEDTKIEVFRNAGELPANTHVAYEKAKAIFSQSPTVPLVKIAFVKKELSLANAIKEVLNIDSDFYAVLPCQTPTLESLQDVAPILESQRLILALDIDDSFLSNTEQIKCDRIICMYNKDITEHLAAAWLGKMLPQAPGSSSWAYQELKNKTPYTLSADKTVSLEKANINRYINIKGVGVTLDGKALSGQFIDIKRGTDWLHVRMQERLFRLLMINKKIPYTLKGIDLVRSEILAQLKEAIYQGVLSENPEPTVSVPTIEDVPEQKRGERVLPQIRFSGRLAGAIHKIEIQGTVTV